MTVITRFAPSPTGLLHIGNARIALINWLYARKHQGNFILRIDDTDNVVCKSEFHQGILQDLKWLGLYWDSTFQQSKRITIYENAARELINLGRIYPCYETQLELEMKRKHQLSLGQPPIYDRSALHLSKEEISKYNQEGRKAHYRFLLNHGKIEWQDMIKDKVTFMGDKLSDPIVIREDESFTYLLCSVIDDIDTKVTHIIRGEDHITNTAIQHQMFTALQANVPTFGHLSLFRAKESKISKRTGSFSIQSLREVENIEAMTINSFLTFSGTSEQVKVYKHLEELLPHLNLKCFNTSPTTYTPQEIYLLNHKLLNQLEYEEVKSQLEKISAEEISKEFWQAIRPNLTKVCEAKTWWEIVNKKPKFKQEQDLEYLNLAAKLLPNGKLDSDSWKIWTNKLAEITKRKGRELYLPLRLAITGRSDGPELQYLLPLISRQELLERLQY